MTAARIPVRARAGWRRLAPRSARLRLTLIYSGMFLVLGTVIVVLIFTIFSGQGSVSSVSQAAPTASGGSKVLHVVADQQHNADVSRLLGGAWVTLLLTALASLPLGWFVAGRVLAPLQRMSLATREISAGSLHQRLALDGPDDEFKRLGDTIDDLLARLEASFSAQRRFVANAAHELRTPLTVERTLLQVALSDPDADAARLRDTCEELIASGRDQERLLDALLTLATSERGLDQRESIELAALVEAALAGSVQSVSELHLTTELSPVIVPGDRALIERLVRNLIDNAIGYNRRGGLVDVRVEGRPGEAVLTVTNTGPSIATDEVDQLFEPFRRRGNERTGTDGHHGLGLSIVRAVAQAHHGEVSATARPDGGLTVTVTFPA